MPTTVNRLTPIEGLVAHSVADDVARSSVAQPLIATRELPDAAFGSMLLKMNSSQVQQLLKVAFDSQNMDPKSPNYGTVPWEIGNPTVNDNNSTVFCMQAVGPVLIGYGDKLTPSFKDDLKPHIEAGIAALRKRDVKLGYTNIYLMKLESLILCGEAVGDSSAAAEGYADLDQWLSYTRKSGIHEFDSPTYYAVDLNSLGLGYRYASDAAGKANFKTALQYFWTDICANYFPGTQTLAGAHSRDYNFLDDAGEMDFYLFLAGLRSQPPKVNTFGAQLAIVLDNFEPGGYMPTSVLLVLASKPNKTVTNTWGYNGLIFNRTNFVTSDFAVGSCSGDYGPQDKLINIEFASKSTLPSITVSPTDDDEPYGQTKTRDAVGHAKPEHLFLHPACAQYKGSLLALLNLSTPHTATGTFSTSVILPLHADDLRIDGTKPLTTDEFTIPGKVGSVVVVRQGAATVAIRLFHATGYRKEKPLISLKADPVGLRLGAARLVIYHYAGEPKILASRSVKVGLLVLATHCQSAAEVAALIKRLNAAVINDIVTSTDWTVSASIANPGSSSTTLYADVDLSRKTSPHIMVNGSVPPASTLAVDGNDLSASILGQDTSPAPAK